MEVIKEFESDLTFFSTELWSTWACDHHLAGKESFSSFWETTMPGTASRLQPHMIDDPSPCWPWGWRSSSQTTAPARFHQTVELSPQIPPGK